LRSNGHWKTSSCAGRKEVVGLNPWAIGGPVAAAGIAAACWASVAPSAQLFGPTIYRLPDRGASREIALTFDDGPNPSVTPGLVDLLDRYQARATFFVIGRFARACPELVREIAARGHSLANHTETHPHMIFLSRARISRELRECQDAVQQALASANLRSRSIRDPGLKGSMKFMRPPFGFRGPQMDGVVRGLGLAGVVMWSRLCYDWKPQPPERIIGRLALVRPRDIVLMHDGDHRHLNGDRGHVSKALAHWLPRWRDAGFEFVTIPLEEGTRIRHG
jgi:peptidoglycan-N-acetylglucosamine deacetylase